MATAKQIAAAKRNTISKKKVMHEAKRIYKSGKHTWGEAMSLAWHQEKLNKGLAQK